MLLAVDNVSDRGAGRLVVSYDAEMTAIVWDLFTGDEIARFASFEPLHVAVWMKDGNVAFGGSPRFTRYRPGFKIANRETKQETHRGTSFCLNLRIQNIVRRARYSIP